MSRCRSTLLSAYLLAIALAEMAQGQLVVTEVMSNSLHPGSDPITGMGGLANGDWFEIVNMGTSPLDMTGYLWDDNNRLSNPTGVTQFPNNFIIQPQEAVLVIEEDHFGVDIPQGFRESWAIPAHVRILARDQMLGQDLFSGLSSNGDEVNIYNGSQQLVAAVAFPSAVPTGGFTFEWDTAGTSLGVSVLGENGAYRATYDGSESQPPVAGADVGSPGIYIGPSGISGDFNNDGLYNCADINALTIAVATGGSVAQYDLNGDTVLNLADVDTWRAEAGGINLGPGRVYRVGDANLDSVVDGSDFNLWNGTKFTSNANWCNGNFNADLVVDGSDFNLWNGNKFTSADGAVVPEPCGWSAFAIAGVILSIRGRRRSV